MFMWQTIDLAIPLHVVVNSALGHDVKSDHCANRFHWNL